MKIRKISLFVLSIFLLSSCGGKSSSGSDVTSSTDTISSDTSSPSSEPITGYALTVKSSDESKGTVSGSGRYEAGETVTVRATPNKDYEFAGWYAGETCVSTDSEYQFEMPEGDYSLTAEWKDRLYALWLDYDANALTITGQGSYAHNQEVTLTAAAKDGYDFDGWYHDDVLLSSDSTYTFSMPGEEYSIHVGSSGKTYNLTLLVNDESLGTVSGPETMTYGYVCWIDAVPNEHSTFVGWYDESGTMVNSYHYYGFQVPNHDYTLTAVFETTKYNLTVNNDSDRGTVTGAGEYAYNDSVTVTATPYDGYSFTGWYDNGNTLISSEASYTFTMPDNDYELTATYSVNSYALKIDNSDPYGGFFSGSGTYEFGSSVTVRAIANTGYDFIGWYDGDTKVSSDAAYTFTMPSHEYTLTVRWQIQSYTVTVVSSDSAGGSVSGGGTYEYGTSVTVTAVPNSGYTFAGWYDGDELVSSDAAYTFTMAVGNMTLTARWTCHVFTLTVANSNTKGGTVSGGGTFNEGESVTVTAAASYGFTFAGWYKGNALLSTSAEYTFPMPSGNLTLTAKWTADQFTVTLASNDTSKGTVSGGGTYGYMDELTIKATPAPGYAFYGWFDDTGYRVLNVTEHYFMMPHENISWTAVFYKPGKDLAASVDEYTMSYGLYPQSRVTDESLISSLDTLTEANSAGYYEYNGEYYAKTKATLSSYARSVKFDDGTLIQSGKEYWFKCEEIEWYILDSDNGDYFITTEKLLDTTVFAPTDSNIYTATDLEGDTAEVNACNYKYSKLRTFLNTDFYNNAFFLDNDNIKTTAVDNSSDTYACEDTNDKIFALSDTEMQTEWYWYYKEATAEPPSDKICLTTEYARARGAYVGTESTAGLYWTRTPGYDGADAACMCTDDGSIYYEGTNDSSVCIRPAMHVRLD